MQFFDQLVTFPCNSIYYLVLMEIETRKIIHQSLFLIRVIPWCSSYFVKKIKKNKKYIKKKHFSKHNVIVFLV